MAKKEFTEEELQVMRERMAKARAARKTKVNVQQGEGTVTFPEEPKQPAPEPTQPIPGVTLTNEQFEALLNRFVGMGNSTPAQKATDIVERFSVNPNHYKNPVEQLYDLPELRRYAMRDNFIIEWKVTPTKYETRQGQWFMEPRFELTLKRKQFDDMGNEMVKKTPDGKEFFPRIILGRASFFEDPPANIIEAELAGLDTSDLNDEEFKEKMRFYRYRTWLVERIIPPKPQLSSRGTREEVIGGKVYEIEEYSKPV